MKKRFSALLLALLVVSSMLIANPKPAYAGGVAYATIGVYVRCASGALPSIGYYQGTWQKDDFSQFLHDLSYDGVMPGNYRAYSYVMMVEGDRFWRTKVDSSGWSTGWSGWKHVTTGYAQSWITYRTVSC